MVVFYRCLEDLLTRGEWLCQCVWCLGINVWKLGFPFSGWGRGIYRDIRPRFSLERVTAHSLNNGPLSYFQGSRGSVVGPDFSLPRKYLIAPFPWLGVKRAFVRGGNCGTLFCRWYAFNKDNYFIFYDDNLCLMMITDDDKSSIID